MDQPLEVLPRVDASTGSPSTYELYGRRVNSVIRLGELASSSPEPFDLSLGLGPAVSLSPNRQRQLPRGDLVIGTGNPEFNIAVAEDDMGYLMRVRGLVDVRFDSALRTGECHPVEGVGLAHLRDLSTTLISTWMVLTGSAVFHASAVANVPGLRTPGAVAFVGPSLAGKSTWAALACRLGASFVTDDALPVATIAGEAVVEGGCEELRLRSFDDSPPFAEGRWKPFSALRHRETADGRVAVRLGRPLNFPLPLAAAIVLDVKTGAGPGELRRLNAREALAKLAGAHRVAGARLERAQVAYFEAAAAIVGSVPVFSTAVPTGQSLGPGTVERLFSELARHLR